MKARPLTVEEAEQLIVPGNRVHVFIPFNDHDVMEGNWSRDHVLKRIREHGCELAGPVARNAGHGVVSEGGGQRVFFQTRRGRDIP